MNPKKFFSEATAELHRVTWPTRAQAVKIVIITLVFVIVSAVFFGALDQILAWAYSEILKLAN